MMKITIYISNNFEPFSNLFIIFIIILEKYKFLKKKNSLTINIRRTQIWT